MIVICRIIVQCHCCLCLSCCMWWMRRLQITIRATLNSIYIKNYNWFVVHFPEKGVQAVHWGAWCLGRCSGQGDVWESPAVPAWQKRLWLLVWPLLASWVHGKLFSCSCQVVEYTVDPFLKLLFKFVYCGVCVCVCVFKVVCVCLCVCVLLGQLGLHYWKVPCVPTLCGRWMLEKSLLLFDDFFNFWNLFCCSNIWFVHTSHYIGLLYSH